MTSAVSSPVPITLHLIRHGDAVDAAGRCVGHHDLDLDERGERRIRELAHHWPAPHPTRVIASDLTRAMRSAVLLAGAWKSGEVRTDARLREMSFGDWDGRTWADLERDDGTRLSEWMAAWQDAATPGGEGFGDVIARVAAWLADTVHEAHADGVTDLAIVAHAGSIRALLVHALGLPRSAAFKLRVDHGRVTTLAVSGDVTHDSCTTAELVSMNGAGP